MLGEPGHGHEYYSPYTSVTPFPNLPTSMGRPIPAPPPRSEYDRHLALNSEVAQSY